MSMGLLQRGAPNPVVSTAIFVLSTVTLTNLLIATLVLLLPTMKQRAQKLQRQRGFHCLVYLALVTLILVGAPGAHGGGGAHSRGGAAHVVRRALRNTSREAGLPGGR